MDDFESYAAQLAQGVHPASRWHPLVATTPRHLLAPNWWQNQAGEWVLHQGPEDPDAWMKAAYSDTSLVTRVGPLHADHARPGQQAGGAPTSSSTLPSLDVRMFRHAMLTETSQVLTVTGSGYGTALLARRLGDQHVTSIDVDPYLVQAAGMRLDMLGLRPTMDVCDITAPLPDTYDRIISTVSVRPIPVSWLTALRPGGRLVTTIKDTGLIVTADKTKDGGAAGQVEWDRAAFMTTRSTATADYPPQLAERFDIIRDSAGEVTQSPYPVVNVPEAWELWSTLSLMVPGIEHRYQTDEYGRRTAWMLHPDGSWARASADDIQPATVHQDGPQRLWTALDRIRRWWLADGSLQTYGATVTITPDGQTTISRGGWSATL